MDWVISGWDTRQSTRMEKEIDLRGGLAARAVSMSSIAKGRLFEQQRRGMRRLIFVSSSWLRSILSDAIQLLVAIEEERREMGPEGEERVDNSRCWIDFILGFGD